MTKSKIKTTFEDDFDEEEKLSPEDQATWDEMEKYSLRVFTNLKKVRLFKVP